MLDGGVDAGPSAHDADIDAGSGMRALELKFTARLTDQGELRCGQQYPGQGRAASTVTPRDFRFYVESVKLLATTGEEVPLLFDDLEGGGFQTRELALIDFTTVGGACEGGPRGSNTSIRGTVPGHLKYDGVHVVIGVPESLNHGDPTRAPAPLQAPGASWDWTAGYRFLIAEVSSMQVPDAGVAHGGMDAGGGAADAGHAAMQPGVGIIHLGSTACTKEGTRFSCANANRAEFTLREFDPERDVIVADLGAVFAGVDVDRGVQCHGAGHACAPMFEALGVEIANGTPRATQSVFSASSQR